MAIGAVLGNHHLAKVQMMTCAGNLSSKSDTGSEVSSVNPAFVDSGRLHSYGVGPPTPTISSRAFAHLL
jgi:hypothetical protein